MTPKALAVIMNDPNTFPKTAAVREGFIATLGHGVVSTVGAVHRVSKVPVVGALSEVLTRDLEAEEASSADIRS